MTTRVIVWMIFLAFLLGASLGTVISAFVWTRICDKWEKLHDDTNNLLQRTYKVLDAWRLACYRYQARLAKYADAYGQLPNDYSEIPDGGEDDFMAGEEP